MLNGHHEQIPGQPPSDRPAPDKPTSGERSPGQNPSLPAAAGCGAGARCDDGPLSVTDCAVGGLAESGKIVGVARAMRGQITLADDFDAPLVGLLWALP